jgi:hypothetical protein
MRKIRLAFALGLLLCTLHLVSGATVVNSTFRDDGAYPYANSLNWLPREVPNNTADKLYNVTAAAGFTLDIDATISNLNFGGGIYSYGHSFTVTGATTTDPATVRDWSVYLQGGSQPITCALGSLSTFANGVLTSRYYLSGPATLQFTGANITTLSHATVTIVNAASRIIDENGVDGLRGLARIEADSALTMGGHQFFTSGDLTVDGSLSVQTVDSVAAFFSITGALTNFDQTSRTLLSGSYAVSGTAGIATLRFTGADIVNNAATLSIAGSSAITDGTGNDALRNFSHNLATGRFTVSNQNFTRNGNFTNDGRVEVFGGSIAITGALTNYDAAAKTLNGGTYRLLSTQGTAPQFSFPGADIVHNNGSIQIYGGKIADENGNDALRNLADNLAGGALEIGLPFTFASDFTNAGTVTLSQKTTVPVGHFYQQSAGKTVINGTNFTGTMDIEGGELEGVTLPGSAHSGIPPKPPSITGSVTIGDAVLKPAQLGVTGDVALSNASTLHYVTTFPDSTAAGVSVSGTLMLGGKLEVEYPGPFPAASLSSFVLAKASTLTGAFSNVANGERITTTDGTGSFLFLITNQNQATLTDYQRAVPASQLMNISTRAQVLTGNNIAIGGFIIYGSDPIQVVMRAIGPSLSSSDVSGPLQDPVLELHDSKGALMATNDNWHDTQAAEISASGLAPKDARESALIATLQPGTYTAVIRGKNDTTGVALVEIYDLSKDANSKLANISTRGFVDPDHVLIGGTIAGGNEQGNAEIVVRALGQDLEIAGIMPPNILIDPAFEIHDADGAVVAANDDAGNPSNNSNTFPRELNPGYQYDAVMGVVLPAGKYTVVVHGKFGTSGNALVEIYDLNH